MPIVVDNPDAVAWDDEADVVIVGFGGAGVAAALEARARGVDVLAVDRFRGGGATHYSGGVLYACGTRYQAEAGFNDTSDEAFKYLSAEHNALGPDTLRRFCDGSNGDVEWLEQHGVPHGSNPYLGKCAFPPEGHWLYYSGNEALPNFSSIAKPAPRGHRVLTPGAGGHLHYSRLRDSALAQGVRLMMHAPARRLIMDRTGRVIGVEVNALPSAQWRAHERLYAKIHPWRPLNGKRAEAAIARCRALEMATNNPKRLRARGGVILSSGGFVYNLSMLTRSRETLGNNYEGLLRLGTMSCDGSGIALGLSAGGATSLMDRFFLGRPLVPPDAFVHGIAVNTRGERFINEDAYLATVGEAITHQPQGKAWLILDRASFWRGVQQIVLPAWLRYRRHGFLVFFNILFGGTKWARSLAGLARKCGVDADALTRTMARYDADARAQRPDALAKSPANIAPMGGGPYYAVNISLSNAFGPTYCFSLGGLLVDETSGLVRKGNTVISGLYAAGRTAVGLCSGGYMSGLAIADTVFSGRRAGAHAATAGQAVINQA